MEESVAEYARQRQGPEAWMLGRYVVPAGRLVELEGAVVGYLPQADGGGPWRLSALLGADVAGDAAAAAAFDDRSGGGAVVDAVELKASTAADVDRSLALLPDGVTAFVELPLDGDLETLLGTLRAGGARAKVRTGGVVPEAIPDPADLARFLEACARADVPFKATAGLHHPVRAEQPLTYAPDSPRAMLHGFLNVFAAAAFARSGAGAEELEAVLREGDARAFTLDDTGLAWRGRRVSAADLRKTREGFACGFGSCSFAEPVAELRGLGVIA